MSTLNILRPITRWLNPVRQTDATLALLQAENAALRAKLQAAELEIKQADSIAEYWYRKTIELAARQSMRVMVWSKN